MPEGGEPKEDGGRGGGEAQGVNPMGKERTASPDLEAFINEGIEISKARGYHPTVLIGMRRRYGTIEAIERLVQSGDIQSGFKRLQDLKLLDWTIEAAAIKFSREFDRHAHECAEWRLSQVNKRAN